MAVIPKDRGGHKIRSGHMLQHDRGYIPVGIEQQFIEAETPTPKSPQLSIVRPAHRHGVLTDGEFGWHESLKALGTKNRSSGKVAEYGDIMLTLVAASDMHRMLQSKVPDLYLTDSRHSLCGYMKSLSVAYRGFVSSRAKAVDTRVNNLIQERMLYRTTEFNTEWDETLYKEGIFKEPVNPDTLAGLWGYLELNVLPDIEAHDKGRLAIALDRNDHLQTELDETLGWLRSEGLNANLSLIKNRDRPQIPIFELNPGMLTIDMFPVPMPGSIDLGSPRMFVD